MHGADFVLVSREEVDGAKLRLTVRIVAAAMERPYLYDPATDSVQLVGPPLLVGGHDMTSIIGKRVREWLRSEVLGRG